MSATLLQSRVMCPCCGYPTLTQRVAYQICRLCDWEDNGQGDDSVDEVWRGPNANYSLAEARANFSRYKVMYSPGCDQRGEGDSPVQNDTKGQLMEAFDRLRLSEPSERPACEQEVLRLEAVLQEELMLLLLEIEAEYEDGI